MQSCDEEVCGDGGYTQAKNIEANTLSWRHSKPPGLFMSSALKTQWSKCVISCYRICILYWRWRWRWTGVYIQLQNSLELQPLWNVSHLFAPSTSFSQWREMLSCYDNEHNWEWTHMITDVSPGWDHTYQLSDKIIKSSNHVKFIHSMQMCVDH